MSQGIVTAKGESILPRIREKNINLHLSQGYRQVSIPQSNFDFNLEGPENNFQEAFDKLNSKATQNIKNRRGSNNSQVSITDLTFVRIFDHHFQVKLPNSNNNFCRTNQN